jgi:hypothetical protein
LPFDDVPCNSSVVVEKNNKFLAVDDKALSMPLVLIIPVVFAAEFFDCPTVERA